MLKIDISALRHQLSLILSHFENKTIFLEYHQYHQSLVKPSHLLLGVTSMKYSFSAFLHPTAICLQEHHRGQPYCGGSW